MAKENIYISWHYTTHGTAFLQHQLAAFWRGELQLSEKPLYKEGLCQLELSEAFSASRQPGFLFDRVYYLCAEQAVLDRLSLRRLSYRKNMYEVDKAVAETQMQEVWREVIAQDLPSWVDEMAYVKAHYSSRLGDFEGQIWRDMQHYPIDSQLAWFRRKSPAAPYYRARFEAVHFSQEELPNLRDEQSILAVLQGFFKNILAHHGAEANYIINVSLGSNETQVAWFVLAEAGLLPPNCRFIKVYDVKTKGKDPRFKNFQIQEIPSRLISSLSANLYEHDNLQSPLRRLADLKMKTYIEQGFAILILGERGTGKSRMISRLERENRKVLAINCASFDDDNKAESEFFGHAKGAYTGAEQAKKGLFEEARDGILFFDEVHHLSKRVQGKLMKALQTDENNNYRFRPMGDSQEQQSQFTAVFASNKSIEELRELLLADFFDRISQLLIELPPLRESRDEIEKDWETVWTQLRFAPSYPCPKSPELFRWLKKQPLWGNFRDLQKIAIYYKAFLDLPKEAQQLEGVEQPLDFAKKEFKAYHGHFPKQTKLPRAFQELFDLELIASETKEKTYKILEKRYKKALIAWVEENFPAQQVWEILDMSESSYYKMKKEG
ncbi:sigma 54-interacting transcriptional regulator [Saprospira grandis]|nr:sigma 54-interacting transcriptional regulator [Saprospira grandis]